ncbi:VOC family protein [Paraburkholderia sp. J41]|uniref:VOC family protein n=1 Tax=Paraburkholderia sp. J41 TaxID=2805433 RepID=UPI002AC35671|nr:VOC family protein [Paraburkholderia sp. J41]
MNERAAQIISLSAVTLTVSDIERSAAFYAALGFARKPGPAVEGFASFVMGGGADAAQTCYLNLLEAPHGAVGGWGRAIFYVADVDAFYAHVTACGATPEFAPRDAPWGERYFHLVDPDGHELSFAKPLA